MARCSAVTERNELLQRSMQMHAETRQTDKCKIKRQNGKLIGAKTHTKLNVEEDQHLDMVTI